MAAARQCDICGKYYPFEFNQAIPTNEPRISITGDESDFLDVCKECRIAIKKVIESRKNINLGKGDESYENN